MCLNHWYSGRRVQRVNVPARIDIVQVYWNTLLALLVIALYLVSTPFSSYFCLLILSLVLSLVSLSHSLFVLLIFLFHSQPHFPLVSLLTLSLLFSSLSWFLAALSSSLPFSPVSPQSSSLSTHKTGGENNKDSIIGLMNRWCRCHRCSCSS